MTIDIKTPLSTARVKAMYSTAYAWRAEDAAGETDLSALRATQAAEFDRWLEAHDREVAEAAVRSSAQVVAETMKTEFAAKIVDLIASLETAKGVLGEARAGYADLEARHAEAEAIIERVRRLHHPQRIQIGSSTHGGPAQFGNACSCGTFGCSLYGLLQGEPSAVLAERERAVAAQERELIIDQVRTAGMHPEGRYGSLNEGSRSQWFANGITEALRRIRAGAMDGDRA